MPEQGSASNPLLRVFLRSDQFWRSGARSTAFAVDVDAKRSIPALCPVLAPASGSGMSAIEMGKPASISMAEAGHLRIRPAPSARGPTSRGRADPERLAQRLDVTGVGQRGLDAVGGRAGAACASPLRFHPHIAQALADQLATHALLLDGVIQPVALVRHQRVRPGNGTAVAPPGNTGPAGSNCRPQPTD